MKGLKKQLFSIGIIVVLILVVCFIPRGNGEAYIYENMTLNLNSLTIPQNAALTIRNSTLSFNGDLSTLGNNDISIENSTIIFRSPGNFILKASNKKLILTDTAVINLKSGFIGSAKTLKFYNVSFVNVSGTVTFQQITNATIKDLTFSNVKANIVPIILNGLQNTVIDGLSYNMPYLYTVTSAVAISVQGCRNVTLNRLKGIGLQNVNTPHFHICLAASGNGNLTISNSYFYGGGNGGVTGLLNWVNCTFDSVVDGTEANKVGLTSFQNCLWTNIKNSEINLQADIRLDFQNCTFMKGLVNLNNGSATLTNCTFPNGLRIIDDGDNQGGQKHAGTMIQFWNYTSIHIGLKMTWTQNLGVLLAPNTEYANYATSVSFNGQGVTIMLTKP